MKFGKAKLVQLAAALVSLGVVAILVLNSVSSQAGPGPNAYTARPTFYDLPVFVYSNSPHTDEVREHLSYCTFHYEITSNASRIESAPAGVPIIVDGYSLNDQNWREVAEACSEALRNGSVVVGLWSHANEFTNAVSDGAYGRGAVGYADGGAGVLWQGLWNGNNSAQASVYTHMGTVGPYGPSMTALTQAYEWAVREAHGQPYHPTLYP